MDHPSIERRGSRYAEWEARLEAFGSAFARFDWYIYNRLSR